MKALFIIAIAAMATFSLTAAEPLPATLAGTWKGSMNTQAGDTAVIITIEPGEALAGTIQAGEYEAPIEKGKISGDKISFEMKMAFGTVAYQGTVSGNLMKLDVTGTQGDQYTLVCTRQ